MGCESASADGKPCDGEPVMRVFWPGSAPLRMCAKHAESANRVANAMGAYVHMEFIDVAHALAKEPGNG